MTLSGRLRSSALVFVVSLPAAIGCSDSSSPATPDAAAAPDARPAPADVDAAPGADTSSDSAPPVAFDYGPLTPGLDKRPTNTTCVAPARPTVKALPAKLSATGCVDAADPKKPAAGLIPYGVNAPLWSDGAEKERYLALPEGARVKIAQDGDFVFPKGTVLVKTFRLEGRLLETRLFVRHDDGGWAGYTYEWNAGQTDAALLEDGKTIAVGAQDWTFPSRKVCLDCHSDAAGGAIGLEIGQLNGPFTYAGNRRANQLATWASLGLFENPPADVTKAAVLVPPGGTAGTAEARARSYLHANCANCHRPDGLPKDAQNKTEIDLRAQSTFAQTKTCNAAPGQKFGYDDAKVIAPGKPELSMMALRMRSKTPSIRMPAVATSVPDDTGIDVVETWIKSLTACP